MEKTQNKPQNYIYYIEGMSLNTLSIAESIRLEDSSKKSKTSVIITNASDDASLTEAFKTLDCKLYKTDITDIDVSALSGSLSTIRFLLTNDDSEENTRKALLLTKLLKDNAAAEIYVTAPGTGPELLFDSVDKGTGLNIYPVKLRRIHPERNLVYNYLYNNSLFELAKDDHGEKVISIIIIGMDSYGIEMLKACLWCGQMDGYVLKIHVIDASKDAEERFYYTAPEVSERNKLPKSGEDYYEITFHPETDCNKTEFLETLNSINNPSLVFISLGKDGTNLETAIKTREIYAKKLLLEEYMPTHYTTVAQSPAIVTIIENDDSASLINENRLKNYKEQAYDIKALGNVRSVYSIQNICSEEFEELALKTHLLWGDEASFNNHEYNRRASLASAIHKKYRDILYPQNNVLKDILEHKRWNAYMRGTEGYSFGLIRDDLAKQHNSLTKYDDLSRPEKKKDTVMNEKL